MSESSGPSGINEDFARLQELLVGREQREIQELREQVEEKELTAEEVAHVLPEAVARRTKEDKRLAETLTPTIEEAIEGSVRRNPSVLADAIFPLMGPAIRKAIRQAMASLLEGINRSLEYGLSPRGIGWRIEAWRTGMPFAEIVLKKSLVYRVEQVFLIHGETALLLEHVSSPEAVVGDAEMISSMLGAIQDFVSDSFSGAGEGEIQQVEFGEFVLEVARGPTAVLACVVRGVPPPRLREEIQVVLEEVHAQKAEELRTFDGDPSTFLSVRGRLEELLLVQRTEQEKKKKKSQLGPGLLALAGVILVTLIVTLVFRSIAGNRRWVTAREALEAEPGLVLVDAERDGDQYSFRGLRDPAARDPAVVLAAAGVDVELIDDLWEPYYSLDPELVLARASEALHPPAQVRLALEDGRLVVSGRSDHAWIHRARAIAPNLPGIFELDDEAFVDLDVERIRGLARRLGEERIRFERNAAVLDDKHASARELARSFRALEQAAREAHVALEVSAVGYSSPDEMAPRALRIARSTAVEDFLRACSAGYAIVDAASPDEGGEVIGMLATLRVDVLDERSATHGR